MGWNVIGFGNIDFHKPIDKRNAQAIVRKLKKLPNASDVWTDNKYSISFEMSGNKWIDYSELKTIKEDMEYAGFSFEIVVHEYTEGECGFYFNSEDVSKKMLECGCGWAETVVMKTG